MTTVLILSWLVWSLFLEYSSFKIIGLVTKFLFFEVVQISQSPVNPPPAMPLRTNYSLLWCAFGAHGGGGGAYMSMYVYMRVCTYFNRLSYQVEVMYEIA